MKKLVYDNKLQAFRAETIEEERERLGDIAFIKQQARMANYLAAPAQEFGFGQQQLDSISDRQQQLDSIFDRAAHRWRDRCPRCGK